MTKKEKIIEVLENLYTEDAVGIWNNYCDEINNPDDCIFAMEDFDLVFSDSTPTEIVNSIGKFSMNDDYFTCGIYGVESFYNIDDYDCWDPNDIANYIIRNDEDFGNDDIWEILNEEESEND